MAKKQEKPAAASPRKLGDNQKLDVAPKAEPGRIVEAIVFNPNQAKNIVVKVRHGDKRALAMIDPIDFVSDVGVGLCAGAIVCEWCADFKERMRLTRSNLRSVHA